jgi:hypothetical protein
MVKGHTEVVTNESIIEKTYLCCSKQIPIPLLPSPLKGEEQNVFPPLQGEGKGGGGVKQMSIQLSTY